MHLLILMGGDTDTTGAIAMSLAAAQFGLAATETLYKETVGLGFTDSTSHPEVASTIRNARALANRYAQRALWYTQREFEQLMASPDLLSLHGLESPPWHKRDDALFFCLDTPEGKYRDLCPGVPAPVRIHGLDWPSVEHYALGGPHAQPSPKLQEYVRGCEDLETARLQANVNTIPLDEYCSALAAAFAARADQDERLRERLLGTGLLRLVAESRAPNLAATQFLSRPCNWSHHRWADIAMAVRARLQAQYECWFNAMDASNVLSNYYAVPSPGLVCPRATALGPLPVYMPQSCGKAAILPMGLPPRASTRNMQCKEHRIKFANTRHLALTVRFAKRSLAPCRVAIADSDRQLKIVKRWDFKVLGSSFYIFFKYLII